MAYTFTTLDDPSATAGTYLQGINDAGQIVGYYDDGSGSHGFFYSGTYSIVGLTSTATGEGTNGYYSSQSVSTAEGINNSGQIARSGFYDNYAEIGEYVGVPPNMKILIRPTMPFRQPAPPHGAKCKHRSTVRSSPARRVR